MIASYSPVERSLIDHCVSFLSRRKCTLFSPEFTSTYTDQFDGYERDIEHLLRTFEASDGLFMFTPTSYEPEAVAAAKGWFAETGRPAYAVGPLLPSASKATAAANEQKQSAESSQILEFMDANLKISGEKSLVYVRLSFKLQLSSAPHR